MSRHIGIDLGTSFSGVATFIYNTNKMIPDEYGKVLIPSMVAFNDNQILVGDDVLYQYVTNAENSIYHVKRLIGRNYDDKHAQGDMKIWPFQVVKGDNNQCRIKVRFNKENNLFSPEEISAQIIKKLKQTSEKYFGQFIHDAVISVPAYFNNNQRIATRNAGLIAGLKVKHIINEPTAAALAYGYGRDVNDTATKTILVYDLGGGTFDISILEICGREFKVLALKGDSHLGGEDFTNRMVNHLFRKFLSSHKIQVELSHQMRHRLREACEKAKTKLSEDLIHHTRIELDHFYVKKDLENYDFYTSFTRDVFENINKDLFDMTMELVDKCLQDANLSPEQIDEVILVGGSTRIPKIRQFLEEKFSKEKVNSQLNPDEAVALGAAIESAILSGDESTSIKYTKLIDVTPLTLGVLVGFDKKMHQFILRNSTIPTRVTSLHVTIEDDQSCAGFNIYEGENELAEDNILLGSFIIDNLPLGPAGSVEFDTTFDLDKDGVLNVTAIEKSTKKSGTITIKQDFGRLSDEEIQHLVKHGKELEQEGQTDLRKSIVKRQLERYTYDAHHFILKESTQDKLKMSVGRKCLGEIENARRFLSNSENETESEFESCLNELKSVCDPAIKDLFLEEEGRNIGEGN